MTRGDTDRCPSDEDLSAYVDGELSSEVRIAFADHLKICTRCRAQGEEFARTSSGLRRVFEAAGDEIGMPEAVSGLTPSRASRQWLFVGIAVAAVVFAVVTLVLFLSLEGPESTFSRPDRSAAQAPLQAASEAEIGRIVFEPSAIPLRADTLPLALGGDVDAQIQLCRLGLSGSLVRADGKPSWPSAPVPTVEEMLADRQRFAALAQRVMGAER